MAYEMRPNDGALFVNDRRREGKKDPNMQGKILLGADLIKELARKGGDQLISVSAWTKDSQSGKRWQSLSVRPWEDKQSSGGSSDGAFDDDIPF